MEQYVKVVTCLIHHEFYIENKNGYFIFVHPILGEFENILFAKRELQYYYIWNNNNMSQEEKINKFWEFFLKNYNEDNILDGNYNLRIQTIYYLGCYL